MKPINDWNNVQAMTNRPQLPTGGYVCKIMGAEEKTYSGPKGSFSKLEVSVDIYEGVHKNFYADDYRNQQTENKKWKGVISYFVPVDDNTEQDNKNKRILKSFIASVEDSNPNYHWDWDEQKLKGKIVGVLFRREEWINNEGKRVWSTKAFMTLPANDIREEKYKTPADKPLQNKTDTPPVNYNIGGTPAEQIASLTDDDLPFGI